MLGVGEVHVTVRYFVGRGETREKFKSTPQGAYRFIGTAQVAVRECEVLLADSDRKGTVVGIEDISRTRECLTRCLVAACVVVAGAEAEVAVGNSERLASCDVDASSCHEGLRCSCVVAHREQHRTHC